MKNTRFAVKTRVLATLVALVTIAYPLYVGFTQSELHLTELRVNPYVLLSAIPIVINIVLLAYFINKHARTEERVWLTFYITTLIVYSVTVLMQQLSGNPHGALFWGAMNSVAVFASAAVYLFTLNYTNQSDRRYTGLTSLILTAAYILALLESATNIVFVNSVKYAQLAPWGFDFRTAIGPAAATAIVWYDVLLLLALSRLISFRRHTRNTVLRRQSLLYIFAISIPLVAGSITDLILPSFGITNIPQLGAVFGSLSAAFFIFGLLKYQLLTVSPTLFSNTILAIMEEAVVVTDKDFDIIFMNEKAEAMLGLKSEGKTSPKLLEQIAHSSLATFQQAFADVVSQNESVTLDHVDLSPPHAQPVPVRVISSRLKLGDYETRVMILSDITNELHTRSIIEHEVQVRTEQLNRARAYLESSISSLEQGFMLVNQKGEVELLNGVASRLTGVKGVDAVGKHIADIVKVLSWNINLAEAVDKVLESQRHKRYDVASEDGSFYEVFATPVIGEKRELGATIIIQDVTERKILDRSKDEFFSIASHELRTPLTAIRGNMSMVKDYFPEAMKDEGLVSMIDDTHDASVRLIEIVSDFLDSSTLEQGKMQFTIQPIDVKPLVEAVQGDLKTLLEKSHDTITLSGLDKLPKIAADEGRLRQIMYNLLSNSLKYSENATITISGEADAHAVKIRVTDTGKGISAENQKLLFHKFQQAGESILTRDNTKGTGLGLYISRLLAQNMHGNVELEKSEEGKGSTFMITLPIAEKKNQRL